MKNEFQISKDDDGIRLHKWMRKIFPLLPLSAIHRSLRTKKVRLNNKHAKGEEVLTEGDHVKFFFDPGGMQQKTSDTATPMVSDLFLQKHFPILFEDEEVILINKPPNIPVHPGSKTSAGKSIIELANIKYPHENIRLVHRLDKDTSGVLLLAKDGGSLRKLVHDLKEGRFQKQYLTLVFGRLSQRSGVIDIPLERQEKGTKMIAGKGKKSVTHYSVQEEFSDCSLVSVALETGRTHQIRAHFAAIGHPVAGDDQHGDFQKNRSFRKEHGLKRQFLHAHSLGFSHPKTGLQVLVTAGLSKDLQSVLDKISKR